MGHGQVAAIQHLVAAAVAGLDSADRVAIVDDRGNLLAGGDDKDGRRRRSATTRRSQTTDFEDRLRQRMESIVGSVVGAGPCPRPGRRRHELQPHPRRRRKATIRTARWSARRQTVEQNCDRQQRQAATAPFRSPTRLPGAAGNQSGGDASKSNCGPHRGNHQLRNLQDGDDQHRRTAAM